MPNPQNIHRPITIVGNGRSGTSLVSQVFDAHSACHYTGETVNLIHSVWYSLAASLPAERHRDIPEVIRTQFLQLFPHDATHWMHKPIGVPIVRHHFGDEDEFCTWFWEVMVAVFPDLRCLTVLRHPLDVLRSSHAWWGRDYREIVDSNRLVARLITHPHSRVEFAVDFHRLVEAPESQVHRLFEYVDLEFEPHCLRPFSKKFVPSDRGAATGRPIDPTSANRDGWREIDPALLIPAYREAVDACWQKFGMSFGPWPI